MNQDQSTPDPQNSPASSELPAESAAPANLAEQNAAADSTAQEAGAAKAPADQPAAENTDAKKSGALKAAGLTALILLLGLIAFGLWKSYQPKALELQGRVEAETIHVSTKVPSRIEEIYVQDGQKVEKGQELVRLYSPEVDAKKQQALAALQSALALQATAERGSQEENIATLYAN